MVFDVSRVRVTELEKITGVPKSNVNRAIKNSQNLIKQNNRILGIEPEVVEQFLIKRGHTEIYGPGIYVVTSQVGGTAKTSSAISLAAAYRRISSRTRPIVLIDTDSQGSLTSQICGEVAADDESVLCDYFDNSSNLEDILCDVGDGVFLIKSNLDNIYLDRALSDPKSIKASAQRLVKDIFKKVGPHAKIFVDTPPQLSAIGQSFFICMASLTDEIDTKVLVPVRCDRFSIRGAKIAVKEARDALETFNLPKDKIDLHVFLTNYDQRVKVSVDTMRAILEDDILKELLCPVVVRYSSEFSKKAFNNNHIFSHGDYRSTIATSDYTDFMLYVMGWTAEEK